MKLNNAALITADADDLSFCINTIRENPHLGTWLSIEFDGAGSTAVVRVTSAALISDADDDYWALDCEITEIHSAPGIDVGYRVHDQCTLTTPADSHSHEAHPDGFLSLPDPPRGSGLPHQTPERDVQEPDEQQNVAPGSTRLALQQDTTHASRHSA